MDLEQRRPSTPSKERIATLFHFPPDEEDNADRPSSKRPRIHHDWSSLDSEKQHYRDDQVAAAPSAPMFPSFSTSVATELVDSTRPTPIDKDIENQNPTEFSIGDTLRRWHRDEPSTVAPDAFTETKKQESQKEQMQVSVHFIADVIECLQRVSDCLGTNHHDINTCRAALQLAIEIMQHRCEDVIAGRETAKNHVQGSMLTSTLRKRTCNCAANKDDLYD
ncbi:hypothetical protein N7456_004907 [Penicillium angulare]|uniref:Uncharacterized protein n=1 Tax=Penicillium angulare TaxID=116970 RepID=A0A9W9FZ47_9EURO|nr:hypothetical protein N7456_004907 [Penicillium angulare]